MDFKQYALMDNYYTGHLNRFVRAISWHISTSNALSVIPNWGCFEVSKCGFLLSRDDGFVNG